MKGPRKLKPYPGGGLFEGISNHIKLVWRLITDPRVSPLLKLIPLGSLVYFIFPFDIPGPFDDAAVIWASTYMFIELCPPDVVAGHRENIENTIPGDWVDISKPKEEDIIDADYETQD